MAALGLTRREVLTSFLGAPLALAACKHREPPFPEGELVGASDRFGHRIRDGESVAPSTWLRKPVVIVGAGVAGLAAAWRLERAGFHDFAVVELEGAPGGTARSGQSPVTAYPWGAHYIPAPLAEDRALVALLGEMGVLDGSDADGEPVVAEQFLCRDPEERVFYRGRWYEGLYLRAGASADDRAQLLRFHREIDRWVGWRDARGRRAFTIPTALCSDDAEVTALDRITMADWMRQNRFTSPRLLWWVDYACRDDYGMRAEDASAWAGLFYFASRVVRPGAESRPLVTWPEGNGRLVAQLLSRVKDRVHLNLAAAQVTPREGGVDVAALDRAGGALGFHADQVIFAAPQFVARHVVRGHVSPGFEYGAWMVANLHLRDRPVERGFPMAWDNVLYESPSLGYVVATHQKGLDRGPTVLTYYYPLVEAGARKMLLATGWREWADVALTDLSRAHPDIRALVRRLDVMRWGHAMIRPRPGFMWGVERRQAAQPSRGVHFAGADLSGVALFEEAFHHGLRAAEEVLAARHIPVESLL